METNQGTRPVRRRRALHVAVALVAATGLVSCVQPDDPPATTTTTTTSTTTTTTSTVPNDTTTLSITGHLEYFGEAQVGARQIRVRTYGDSGETIPGGVLITVNASAPYGSFSTVINLGDDVESVNLIAQTETPSGTAYFPSNSYPIVADQANSGVYNTHGSYLSFEGSFTRDGEPYTQSAPFMVQVQAYDADGEPYGIPLVGDVHFEPNGKVYLTDFLAYDSFAGGDSSTDPTSIYMFFTDFENPDDSATYVIDLTDGAAFYSVDDTVNIETDIGAA